MMALLRPLIAAGRHGRMLLVAGLVAGIAFPGLAAAMKPWLRELVAILLFVSALRIGARNIAGGLRALPATFLTLGVFQLALPLAAVAIFSLAGMAATPFAAALVLMLSASPISGSPNLAILTGHDPAPAFRLLVLGTALLPFTVLPVFWLLPQLGSAGEVFGAAGRLFAVIALAASAAFAIRHFLLREPSPDTITALDGLGAIAMAVVVVGLMSAVGPALTRDLPGFLGWLAVAFTANFGLQIVTALLLRKAGASRTAVPYGICAGNRNIALFLASLPASVTDPLLLFIGCYQIPMYLTPVLLRRFYSRDQ